MRRRCRPYSVSVRSRLPLHVRVTWKIEEHMRSTALLCCTLLLVACGGEETPAADTAAVAPAPAPAPAALSLSELAGNWTQTVRNETSDSILVTAPVVATADTTGWTVTLPN